MVSVCVPGPGCDTNFAAHVPVQLMVVVMVVFCVPGHSTKQADVVGVMISRPGLPTPVTQPPICQCQLVGAESSRRVSQIVDMYMG